MRRLHVRIYLAVLASLVVFAVAATAAIALLLRRLSDRTFFAQMFRPVPVKAEG